MKHLGPELRLERLVILVSVHVKLVRGGVEALEAGASINKGKVDIFWFDPYHMTRKMMVVIASKRLWDPLY